MAERIAEAFYAIVLLAQHDGVARINELPGCWHREFSPWELWLNGHDETAKGGPRGNTDVPQFSAYVEFNGWPAGIIDPAGGIIAAGDVASEGTFIAAIEAIIGRPVNATPPGGGTGE